MKILNKTKEHRYRILEVSPVCDIIVYVFDRLGIEYTSSVLPYEGNDACQYVEYVSHMDDDDYEWFNKNFMSRFGDVNMYNCFEVI